MATNSEENNIQHKRKTIYDGIKISLSALNLTVIALTVLIMLLILLAMVISS